MPAAIAPEETITTSEPAFIRDSMASASWANLPASEQPGLGGQRGGADLDHDAARGADRVAVGCSPAGSLRDVAHVVPAVFAALAAKLLALGGPDPVVVFRAGVGAAPGRCDVHPGRGLRLPLKVISPMVTQPVWRHVL